MFGGWRIVKTMGTGITKLQPYRRLLRGDGRGDRHPASRLCAASRSSTTHTITGAIVGVGSTKRVSAVKWGVAGRIVWAWILTIPLSAAMSALSYFVIRLF